MQSLTLIIPGLFGPDARFHEDYVPSLPALELLLSLARHSVSLYTNTEYHRTLANLLALDIPADRDVPVAAITRYQDNAGDTSGIWMRADPVHLSADRDGLILMDSFILNLSQHDALAIAAEANQVLQDYGLTIEVPFEDRWYIQLDDVLDMTTTELSSIVGSEVTAYLPIGEGSGKIHGLLNELQMHLFSSDINQQREARGELPVNSIWLWGSGQLEDISQTDLSVMFTDDIYATCLAQLTSTACYPVPNHFLGMTAHYQEGDEVMTILMHCQAPRQYQNLDLWQKALSLLEGSWFVPALEWLQQGKLKKLRIISDEHEFEVTRLGLKKFWKKPRSIFHYKRFPSYAKEN
jgi:hypothetical protein